MGLGEFDLIRRYFLRDSSRTDVALGVGDDAAVLRVEQGNELVVSVDNLTSGVHFSPGADPAALGHRVLAVNLSDIAAMGATPCWATLALSLPQIDEGWLGGFADGFFQLARTHGVDLVGGDTVRGPLNITVQIMGQVPAGGALRRSGAGIGDRIFVTGKLGEAALALKLRDGQHDVPRALAEKLDRPLPRIADGIGLRGIASACIDVSDGLAADLGHIVEESKCGARIVEKNLPLAARPAPVLTDEDCLKAALFGGDDYELCFTVPADRIEALPLDVLAHSVQIGEIDGGPGVRLLSTDGDISSLECDGGYRHF